MLVSAASPSPQPQQHPHPLLLVVFILLPPFSGAVDETGSAAETTTVEEGFGFKGGLLPVKREGRGIGELAGLGKTTREGGLGNLGSGGAIAESNRIGPLLC